MFYDREYGSHVLQHFEVKKSKIQNKKKAIRYRCLVSAAQVSLFKF